MHGYVYVIFTHDDNWLNYFSDIDECASNPCLNEATCNDLSNSYKCTCVIGYRGKMCETGIYGNIGHKNVII